MIHKLIIIITIYLKLLSYSECTLIERLKSKSNIFYSADSHLPEPVELDDHDEGRRPGGGPPQQTDPSGEVQTEGGQPDSYLTVRLVS